MPNGISYTPDGQSIYPEYLADTELFQCPSSETYTEDDWHFGNNPLFPVDPCAATNDSYVYLGWGILEEHVILEGADPNATPPSSAVDSAFVAVFVDPSVPSGVLFENAFDFELTGEAFDQDLSIQTINPSSTDRPIHRLREGIERFYITDINSPADSAMAQSTLPVMWDRVATDVNRDGFNHLPGGANVLYLDGHVDYLKFPGAHPTSRAYAFVISTLYDVIYP